jgi:hypothetical protein
MPTVCRTFVLVSRGNKRWDAKRRIFSDKAMINNPRVKRMDRIYRMGRISIFASELPLLESAAPSTITTGQAFGNAAPGRCAPASPFHPTSLVAPSGITKPRISLLPSRDTGREEGKGEAGWEGWHRDVPDHIMINEELN